MVKYITFKVEKEKTTFKTVVKLMNRKCFFQ
jgi:hypothetical protein